VSKSGKHKCQATRFLAACQYPWITGSLVSCKELYIESNIKFKLIKLFVLVAFLQFPILNPVSQQIFCHSVRLRGVVPVGKWRQCIPSIKSLQDLVRSIKISPLLTTYQTELTWKPGETLW